MKSATYKNNKIEIIETNKPELKNQGAIVKVIGCGLCGSDLLKIKNNEQNPTLGHEVVGEIVELNTEQDFKIGDKVAFGHHYPCFNCEYCNIEAYSMCKIFKNSNIFPNGFSEYVYIDENHLRYTVYKVQENLQDDESTNLEPLACIVRSIRRAGFEQEKDNSNKSALVLGLGFIGILTAQALKAYGVETYGFDINQDRMEFAKKYNVEFKEQKFDTIFMCSGSSKAIDTALKSVRDGGKIIVFSSIENEDGFKNNDIYFRDLSIIASYSPSMLDYKISNELLSKKKVNTKGISTHYSLDNLSLAVEDVISSKTLKAYITL